MTQHLATSHKLLYMVATLALAGCAASHVPSAPQARRPVAKKEVLDPSPAITAASLALAQTRSGPVLPDTLATKKVTAVFVSPDVTPSKLRALSENIAETPTNQPGRVTEKPEPAKSAPAAKPKVQARYYATIFTSKKTGLICPRCVELRQKWGKGNNLVELDWSGDPAPDGPQSYPAIRWIDRAGVPRYPTKPNQFGQQEYFIPDSLDQLREIIERSNGGFGKSAAVPGRSKAIQAIQWVRDNIGEGVPMSFNWDRTGAQTFPLLKNQDFSAIALLGKSGRIGLSAPGCKLPVDHVGFGYQVEGDDLLIDVDPVKFEGLAAKLLPQNQSAITSRPVAFVDPLTLWSIFSVFKTVWGLLHPQADLTLGGNVSATATLQGDTLAIDFQQMPSVRLVMLFTFHIAVRRLEITADSVRILFEGSRLVRERTILLTD